MGVFSRGRLCVWEARAGSMTLSTSDGNAIILPCNPSRGKTYILCEQIPAEAVGPEQQLNSGAAVAAPMARAGHRGLGRLSHRLVCGLVPHTGLCHSASPAPSILCFDQFE